jgi:hypothetical protein
VAHVSAAIALKTLTKTACFQRSVPCVGKEVKDE